MSDVETYRGYLITKNFSNGKFHQKTKSRTTDDLLVVVHGEAQPLPGSIFFTTKMKAQQVIDLWFHVQHNVEEFWKGFRNLNDPDAETALALQSFEHAESEPRKKLWKRK